MPVLGTSSAVIARPVNRISLALRGPEFPCVAVVLDAADAHEHDRVGELRIVGGDDQVARPAQQQPAGDAPTLDGGDRRLGHVAPAQGVLEVAPGLVLDDDVEGDLVGHRPSAPEVMAGREVFSVGAQHDHRDVVVLGGARPGSVEFVEQLGVLRVGGLRPIQRDGRDAIGDLIVDVHGCSSVSGQAQHSLGNDVALDF